MHSELDALCSVGFRHIVEDGIAILENKDLPQPRKNAVLKDLASIAAEAKQYSELTHGRSWLFAASNRETYELFSLLAQRMKTDQRSWEESILAAASVFQKLSEGQRPIKSETTSANAFLQALHNCITSLPRLRLPTHSDDTSQLTRI